MRSGLKALTILLALFFAAGAAAEGTNRFEEAVPLGDRELTVRGTAVLRWGLLFDVYAGALYLPADVSSEQWDADVPKRLELVYFRGIEAEKFVESSDLLLRKNLPPEEYRSLRDRLQLFYTFFRDVRPGDRYSLTYRPGVGTELAFNGEALGTVPGGDFARAYFGLWLGPEPIDEAFRDRLLLGSRS